MMATNPNYNFLSENWRKHRVFVLQGGTRSGKTYSVLNFMIRACIKYQGAGMTITVCRKTLPALRGSAYRDFLQLIKSYGLYDESHHNKSELAYSLNGNVIEFISIDQPDKVRGRKRDILFVNEASELDFEDWQQLMFRTTAKAVIDYNPSMPDHWIYDKVLSRTDMTMFVSTYKDNPYLSPGQIKEIESLEGQDGEYWKVFGLGQRGNIYAGLIYKNWKLFEGQQPNGKTIYGLDFGFSSDPCALIKVVIVGNDCYLQEVLYRTGMTNPDLIREIKAVGVGHAPIYCDNSPDRIEELFRAGLNAKPAKKGGGSLEAGITMLQSKNLFLSGNALNLAKEIKSYKYRTDRNGNALPEPVDYLNHAMDAMRYAIFTESMIPMASPTWGGSSGKPKRI